jgi:hypothetical protein
MYVRNQLLTFISWIVSGPSHAPHWANVLRVQGAMLAMFRCSWEHVDQTEKWSCLSVRITENNVRQDLKFTFFNACENRESPINTSAHL